MSAPQPPEAAVEAGRRALYGAFQSGQPDSVRVILTAALPHLRRAWLEELADAWDEGHRSGEWNYEHRRMIEHYPREAKKNPYRAKGPAK